MRRNINTFIVISDEIDQELDEVGIPPEMKLCIPNGVGANLLRYPDSPQDIREGLGMHASLVAVFIGCPELEKSLDLLIGAWNRNHDRYSNSLLLVIREGTELEKSRLMASPSVQSVGRVDNNAPFWQATDVVVLPSEREGLSNGLLEAVSTGLAVIVADVGAVRDVNTDIAYKSCRLHKKLISEHKSGWVFYFWLQY